MGATDLFLTKKSLKSQCVAHKINSIQHSNQVWRFLHFGLHKIKHVLIYEPRQGTFPLPCLMKLFVDLLCPLGGTVRLHRSAPPSELHLLPSRCSSLPIILGRAPLCVTGPEDVHPELLRLLSDVSVVEVEPSVVPQEMLAHLRLALPSSPVLLFLTLHQRILYYPNDACFTKSGSFFSRQIT